MLEGYVGAQVRRANRNLLLTNVLIAIVVLAIPVLGFSYIMECLLGPFTMTAEEISRLNTKADAPHRFVQVDLDPDNFDERYYSITGGKDHKNDHYFFYHLANNRILIVRNHSKSVPAKAVGSLSNFDSDVSGKVLPGVQAGLKGDMRPVMLDLSSYRIGLWIMLGICVPLGVVAAWNIKKVVTRMSDPLKHPMLKQLALMGPPEEIAIAVDAEVKEGGVKVGKVLTTRSWLIRPQTYSTDMLYLGDIAWAYKHETVHKSYGVTTNHTYATVVFDVRGKRWNFPLSLAQVEGLLKELSTHVPWAIIGFNEEIQKAWQKNRGEVLAAIEERKRKITEAPQAETAPAPEEKIVGDVPPIQGN